VSRTSVREAIQKLTSQGVLSARRGDGTYLQSRATAEWLQEGTQPLAGLIDADPHYRYDVLEAPGAGKQHRLAGRPARHRPGQGAHQHCFEVMLTTSKTATPNWPRVPTRSSTWPLPRPRTTWCWFR
jgi:GntR family L-lactate dehydrogenase operon transcriptional regulator